MSYSPNKIKAYHALLKVASTFRIIEREVYERKVIELKKEILAEIDASPRDGSLANYNWTGGKIYKKAPRIFKSDIDFATSAIISDVWASALDLDNSRANWTEEDYLEMIRSVPDVKKDEIFDDVIPISFKKNFSFIEKCIKEGCRVFNRYSWARLNEEHIRNWSEDDIRSLIGNNLVSADGKEALFALLPSSYRSNLDIIELFVENGVPISNIQYHIIIDNFDKSDYLRFFSMPISSRLYIEKVPLEIRGDMDFIELILNRQGISRSNYLAEYINYELLTPSDCLALLNMPNIYPEEKIVIFANSQSEVRANIEAIRLAINKEGYNDNNRLVHSIDYQNLQDKYAYIELLTSEHLTLDDKKDIAKRIPHLLGDVDIVDIIINKFSYHGERFSEYINETLDFSTWTEEDYIRMLLGGKEKDYRLHENFSRIPEEVRNTISFLEKLIEANLNTVASLVSAKDWDKETIIELMYNDYLVDKSSIFKSANPELSKVLEGMGFGKYQVNQMTEEQIDALELSFISTKEEFLLLLSYPFIGRLNREQLFRRAPEEWRNDISFFATSLCLVNNSNYSSDSISHFKRMATHVDTSKWQEADEIALLLACNKSETTKNLLFGTIISAHSRVDYNYIVSCVNKGVTDLFSDSISPDWSQEEFEALIKNTHLNARDRKQLFKISPPYMRGDIEYIKLSLINGAPGDIVKDISYDELKEEDCFTLVKMPNLSFDDRNHIYRCAPAGLRDSADFLLLVTEDSVASVAIASQGLQNNDKVILQILERNPRFIYEMPFGIQARVLESIFSDAGTYASINEKFDKETLLEKMMSPNISSLDKYMENICKIIGTSNRITDLMSKYIGTIYTPESALKLLDIISDGNINISNVYSYFGTVRMDHAVIEKMLLLASSDEHENILSRLREDIKKEYRPSIPNVLELKKLDSKLFAGYEKFISLQNEDGTYQYARFMDDIERIVTTNSSYTDEPQLFAWDLVQQKLSTEISDLPIPPEYVIKAVGTTKEHIEAFYNANEIWSYLENTEFYQSATAEAKVEIIKLFAHLGCFEYGAKELKQSQREALRKGQTQIIEDVCAKLTSSNMHDLFGGLPKGFSLTKLLDEQDINQEISSSDRKRYDEKGKHSIPFFMKNIRVSAPKRPVEGTPNYEEELEDYNRLLEEYNKHIFDFRMVASYSLTNFVKESASLAGRQLQAKKTLEEAALRSKEPAVIAAVREVEVRNAAVLEYLENNDKTKISTSEEKNKYNRELAALEEAKKKARDILVVTMGSSEEKETLHAYEEYKKSDHKFCLQDLIEAFAHNAFPHARIPKIAEAAIAAGYKSAIGEDVRAVDVLCDMYDAALAAPEKFFAEEVTDTAQEGARFTFYWPRKNAQDIPQLTVIAKTVGENNMAPCMRPFHQNESALWESLTSRTVKVGYILEGIKPIAYVRVNYDESGKGIYIDVVESRKNLLFETAEEEIWNTVKRAVIALAERTHEKGEGFEVKVVNFRQDAYNKLAARYNSLPPSKYLLHGRKYRDARATNHKEYGEDAPREQKEVWINPEYLDEGGKVR